MCLLSCPLTLNDQSFFLKLSLSPFWGGSIQFLMFILGWYLVSPLLSYNAKTRTTFPLVEAWPVWGCCKDLFPGSHLSDSCCAIFDDVADLLWPFPSMDPASIRTGWTNSMPGIPSALPTTFLPPHRVAPGAVDQAFTHQPLTTWGCSCWLCGCDDTFMTVDFGPRATGEIEDGSFLLLLVLLAGLAFHITHPSPHHPASVPWLLISRVPSPWGNSHTWLYRTYTKCYLSDFGCYLISLSLCFLDRGLTNGTK